MQNEKINTFNKMPKILQINVCLNLSTGKIAQQIGEAAMADGWESWIAYSGRDPYDESNSNVIRVGNFADACIHYAGQRLFDCEGLGSTYYTKRLVHKIEEIKPDIVLLHNIHDHWLNYPILFGCLIKMQVPVIWTQHDCWAFTGGCMYFDMLNCDRWKDGCNNCPDNRVLIKNQATRNLSLKTQYLSQIKDLIFVPVSDWIGDMIRESYQKDRRIITIHNGIDLSKFKPTHSNHQDGKYRILGVASTWDARKGLNDFVKLRKLLPDNFIITLVGLSKEQLKKLPLGIDGMSRTDGVEELAKLYSEADVYVNTTYSDNFPTVNLEALACGTPVITYRTGGSQEAIDENTGAVIEQGDIDALCKKIQEVKTIGFKQQHTIDCRKRAEVNFDKDKCFMKYIDLFNELIETKNA